MVTLEQRFTDEIVAHARAEDPNECCGVLLGQDGRVVALRRVPNAEQSPYRYNMDPQEFYRVYKEAERNGWEMWGFYHSHTHTQAYPSQTDRNLASWPDSYYLIVSLADKAKPILRAFRILNGSVEEHDIRATSG
ncbi:MAG: M67 family metallopeptidase [Chloroflexi bacterium]|nr:M67 family metallopeptidase [Chloroflexota bacterium]